MERCMWRALRRGVCSMFYAQTESASTHVCVRAHTRIRARVHMSACVGAPVAVRACMSVHTSHDTGPSPAPTSEPLMSE